MPLHLCFNIIITEAGVFRIFLQVAFLFEDLKMELYPALAICVSFSLGLWSSFVSVWAEGTTSESLTNSNGGVNTEEKISIKSTTNSRLEFEDPYFGTLVPSTQNVTFLTVDDVQFRDAVLIYPSDRQKRLMKAWRDRGVSRRLKFFRFKRDTDQCDINLKGFVKDEFGEIQHAKAPGQQGPDLAFDKLEENSYFRAFLILQRRLDSYVDNRFGRALERVKNRGKPWLPADELKEELKDCHYLVKTFASSHDFKFDRSVGGNISYYKFSCEQVRQYIIFAFATYDCKFELMPITVTEKPGEETLGTGLLVGEVAKKRIHTEKRHLTWKEKEDLVQYIGRMVRRQIKYEYGTYFAEEERLASCSK